MLVDAGFKPDYLDLRDASNLQPATADTRDFAILAAAFLGNTRLIDNLLCKLA